jgi:hypothetical protein
MSDQTASDIVQNALGEHYVDQTGTTKRSWRPFVILGVVLAVGFLAWKALRRRSR